MIAEAGLAALWIAAALSLLQLCAGVSASWGEGEALRSPADQSRHYSLCTLSKIVERLQRDELRGFGMSGAKIASLAMITVLALASTEASSRTASLEPQLTRASRFLVQRIGASHFTLNAAAALGSHWGTITSTTRTWEHNRLVGGVANSFHLVGRAIDIARRPGVRHADIAASFRNAGFTLIESLDEGDHSHFAFAFGETRLAAAKVLRGPPHQAMALRTSECGAVAKTHNAALQRRRPDRNEDCLPAEDLRDAASAVAVDATAFD